MTITTTIGGAASDSYVTLAEFIAYGASVGWDIGGHGHEDAHEQNLRRAAQYLERKFSFIGYKVTKAQALAWPRYVSGYPLDGYAVDPDEIPLPVKHAQMEMAWLIHEGATPFATVESGSISRSKVKAGPVESETEYSGGGRELPRYVAIEGLLEDLVDGSGSGSATLKMGRG